jgi:hypothetical protein
MSKIIAFSGRKQAGKGSCTNYILGLGLIASGAVKQFRVDDEGQLVVPVADESNVETTGLGIIDRFRRDEEFTLWAEDMLWPIVKNYSFADKLKEIAIEMFGLSPEQVYGTDDEKNTLTDINWEDIPGVLATISQIEWQGYLDALAEYQNITEGFTFHKYLFQDMSKFNIHLPGKMTGREFLQVFGTDIMRRINPDVHVNGCMTQIAKDSPEIAVIEDIRFPNEVEAVQRAGGKVVRLLRAPYKSKDEHESESALDDYEGFDAVVDNTDINITETNKVIWNILVKWEFIAGKI